MENPILTVKSIQPGLAYLQYRLLPSPPTPPHYVIHNKMAVQHQNRTHTQPLSVKLRLKPLTALLLAAWDEANRGHSDPLVLLNLYYKTWKGMRWPLE